MSKGRLPDDEMYFQLLGPLEVSDQGRPVPVGAGKRRALLALLYKGGAVPGRSSTMRERSQAWPPSSDSVPDRLERTRGPNPVGPAS